MSQNWAQIGNLNNTPRVFLNDTISDLLYISGNFRFNGTDTIDGFCSFNGQVFKSLGRRQDCSHYGCDPAFLIARYGNYLYFSGPNLIRIDSVVVTGIAQFDGLEWRDGLLGLARSGDNPWLDSYYIHDSLFYGVGAFRTADGDTCNSVAYWNGQKWTGLGFLPWSDNTTPRVTNVIFYQNQLYVGGNFSWEGSGGADIATLDSTGWHMVGGGVYGGSANVFDMEVYKNELYICGYFSKWDGNVGNKIMRWNGITWKEVGAGFCSPNITPTDMAVIGNKLYVVGNFDCVENDISASKIATWDGERWCSLGQSFFNNTITGIIEYHDEIYVGGGFTEVDGQPCSYFAKWVGDESTNICSDPISAAPVPQIAKEQLPLWPNPVTDILRIPVSQPVAVIQVYDGVGREITGLSSTISAGAVQLDVAMLPAGLYFIRLRVGTEVLGGRFVKE